MIDLFVMFIIGAGAYLFNAKRTLRYMRYFQQEEYSPARFSEWLRRHRTFDMRGSLLSFALCIVQAGFGLLPAGAIAAGLIGFGLFTALTIWEPDPRTVGKVRLNLTERARRIISLTLAFALVVELAACALALALGQYAALGLELPFAQVGPPILWFLQAPVFRCIPYLLMLAVTVLQPGEDSRQQGFVNEARSLLATTDPYVVGVVGSWGKTSTKNLLGELLNATLAPTFWPPKGINTLMGITREIRERLRPGFEYAVIEMGDYQRGSIKKLCDFTPPHAGIVTAIGLEHLERFGSEENIYLAKTELADAIPQSGILVVNGDNDQCRRLAREHARDTTILYGLEPERGSLECYATDVTFTENGTSFTLHWRGESVAITTKFLGRPNVLNIIGGAAMALALGADLQYLGAVIRNLEPVDNRLSVTKDGGIVYLNDAYNSNPVGFRSALDVLKGLPGNRKILMTPGMIELADKQADENRAVGVFAARCCTDAVIVGPTNREALVAGLLEGGLARERIHEAHNRDAAFAKLAELRQPGDVILLENDLTDLYEAVEKF